MLKCTSISKWFKHSHSFQCLFMHILDKICNKISMIFNTFTCSKHFWSFAPWRSTHHKICQVFQWSMCIPTNFNNYLLISSLNPLVWPFIRIVSLSREITKASVFLCALYLFLWKQLIYVTFKWSASDQITTMQCLEAPIAHWNTHIMRQNWPKK